MYSLSYFDFKLAGSAVLPIPVFHCHHTYFSLVHTKKRHFHTAKDLRWLGVFFAPVPTLSILKTFRQKFSPLTPLDIRAQLTHFFRLKFLRTTRVASRASDANAPSLSHSLSQKQHPIAHKNSQ